MLDGTNCCAVALGTFSNTSVYQCTCTEHSAIDDKRGHFRTVGPQDGNSFL